MLFYLIYVSKATAPIADAGLFKILDVSREWNEDHGLSGMLLYIKGEPMGQHSGRFIQVLEGIEAEVRQIFDKISSDRRHSHITLLNEGTMKARNFEKWRMGFGSVTAADLINHPGCAELTSDFLDSLDPKRFNFALSFLKSFYELRSTIC